MTDMESPLPVILCGKTEQIATSVIETLRPEIEVIHLILTPSAGKTQIPALLRGEKDVPSASSLGSTNYKNSPVAIILGAGYDDEMVEQMRDAAKGTKDVPWLRPDTSKPAPPIGPEYGKAMVTRIKETVKVLQERGDLGKGGVVWY